MNTKQLNLLEISPELAYIIGVLQGDGYVHKNYLSLETADKDFGEYFCLQIEKWTGYKPLIATGKTRHTMKIDNKKYICRKTYRVFLCGRRFTEFLLENFIFKTNVWRVPKQIFNGSKEIKTAYIRGIFDSEGYVGIHKNNCRITISSQNINALKQIKDLLRTLNFTSVIYPLKKRELFSLEIKKVHEIVRFYKEIGTSIKRKQKIFEKIEEHCKNSQKYTIEDYHKVLELKEKGFGSRKINKITKIPRTTIIHWIRRERLPRVLRYNNEIKHFNKPAVLHNS